MKGFNISIVYNITEDKLLMCKRTKAPYKGMYNFVGGQIEENEDDLDAAYRELFEETSITKSDISLTHLMTIIYKMSDIELQVYIGKLNKDIDVVEEINTLHWIDINSDFFNQTLFAGEGNIGHMIEQVKIYKDRLLNVKVEV